jgi:hypothetical protein
MAQPDASAEASGPNPDEQLIKVFETEQESEALVVKGLLDSAGIENDVVSDLSQDAFPGLGGTVILVREEDAEKARQLIAESRQQVPVDAAGDVEDDETRG